MNVTLSQFRSRQFGSAPYGNLSVLVFALAISAAGAAVNSDSAVALAVGDVIDLGPLPAGMRLDDASTIVSDALAANVTGSLGFKYSDGVDSIAVPQDAAYFGAGIALSATGRLRSTVGKAPAVLPKDARLILTLAGAAPGQAGKVDVQVFGELLGPA